MGFIEREITEEDKKWLEQFHIPYPFSNRFDPDYGEILIEDKENEAVLISLGGQGYMEQETDFYSDLPRVLYLIWNGYCLYIECHHEIYEMAENSEKYGVKYAVDKIANRADQYPERDIDLMKKTIKELLKEALLVYKIYFNDSFEKVEFLKMAEPRYL